MGYAEWRKSDLELKLAPDRTISSDLLRGLSNRPLSIPSKYFYDDRGSALFDAICDLPEYYPTRTERALLHDVADEIARCMETDHLVELGAGTARKTGALIEAYRAGGGGLRYTPVDISQYALDQAEESISDAFPGVEIRGVRCDYTETLAELNPGSGCLVVFLGSTIGNFSHPRGVALLSRLRRQLDSGSGLLMGVDLVKPVPVLEAAYNDSEGITAAFNRNILKVVNREAEADFYPEDFRHLAFFNEEASRIEMHLEAVRDLRVTCSAANLVLDIGAGERILTEISRKFTRESAARLLAEAGFRLRRWFVSQNGYFALALAGAVES